MWTHFFDEQLFGRLASTQLEMLSIVPKISLVEEKISKPQSGQKPSRSNFHLKLVTRSFKTPRIGLHNREYFQSEDEIKTLATISHRFTLTCNISHVGRREKNLRIPLADTYQMPNYIHASSIIFRVNYSICAGMQTKRKMQLMNSFKPITKIIRNLFK